MAYLPPADVYLVERLVYGERLLMVPDQFQRHPAELAMKPSESTHQRE
jgi:hypothetical protein